MEKSLKQVKLDEILLQEKIQNEKLEKARIEKAEKAEKERILNENIEKERAQKEEKERIENEKMLRLMESSKVEPPKEPEPTSVSNSAPISNTPKTQNILKSEPKPLENVAIQPSQQSTLSNSECVASPKAHEVALNYISFIKVNFKMLSFSYFLILIYSKHILENQI